MSDPMSDIHYKGLPSQPRLIATTIPGPYEEPSGPEADPAPKELRQLGDHPLASAWDRGLPSALRRALNAMRVNWTSIDALRIAEAGGPPGPAAVIWIGVESDFAGAGAVARGCRAIVGSYGVGECHVEVREVRVVRQAGGRFFDPVPVSEPTFAVRDAYTATLGIPISAWRRPWVEGTGGFYVSAGGDDLDVYLVTARHVVLPVYEDDNEEYECTGRAREDVVVLGTSGFNENLAAIEYDIKGQEYAITDAKERIESVEGMDDPMSVTERRKAERDLREAEDGLKGLGAFHHEIGTHWGEMEKRIFGQLVWAPPIVLSTEPGQYTLDLAVIKIDAGKLDAGNYRGNSINIGNKYTRRQFMDKVHPNPASSPGPFKFPANRIVALTDQVPESALADQPMLDANGDQCLIVFKNGAKTGTTIGRANNVPSYTRSYLAGRYQESREWPVIPTDQYPGAFSAEGDSGSCIADAFGRIGGIITGGASSPDRPDSADVTYATPISFIMEVLRGNERFAHAHLDPVLA